MKVSEFINECENFEYSKEYFDLYKESNEIVPLFLLHLPTRFKKYMR